jgi:hypothetical protein
MPRQLAKDNYVKLMIVTHLLGSLDDGLKSVNRTFRLDEDLLSSVRQLAHQRNASLNQVVVDALRKTAADALVDGLEMEHVPSAFILKMMAYLPDEKLAELGRWSVSHFSRDFVWEVFKEISLDTLIKSYEVLSTKYDRLFTFEHLKVGQEHSLKILHSRGPKWSIFCAESLRFAFKDLVGIEIEVEWGPNEVRGRFIEAHPTPRHKKISAADRLLASAATA